MAKLEWRSCKINYESGLAGSVDYSFISNDLWEGSDEEKFKKADMNYSERLVRFRCVSCGEPHDVPCCSNCRRGYYEAGYATNGAAGLFCKNCGSGFTSWNCPSCGAKNPIGNSIESLDKSGCFIATAVYESYEAPEVLILRKVRDEIFLNSKFGKLFVNFYYQLSPPFANYLSTTKGLKVIIRDNILTPLVKFIERKLNK